MQLLSLGRRSRQLEVLPWRVLMSLARCCIGCIFKAAGPAPQKGLSCLPLCAWRQGLADAALGPGLATDVLRQWLCVGLACDEQRIVFAGKQLEDEELLSLAGVEAEATLQVLGRLAWLRPWRSPRGGCPRGPCFGRRSMGCLGGCFSS